MDDRGKKKKKGTGEQFYFSIHHFYSHVRALLLIVVHVTRKSKKGGLVTDRRLHWAFNGCEGHPIPATTGRAVISLPGVASGDHAFEVWDEVTGERVSDTITISPKQPDASERVTALRIRVLYPVKDVQGRTTARALVRAFRKDGMLAPDRTIIYVWDGLDGVDKQSGVLNSGTDSADSGATTIDAPPTLLPGTHYFDAWDEETGVYGCAEFQVPEPTPTTVCLDLDVAYPVRDPVSSDFGALVTVYASKRPGRIELLEDRRLRLVLDGLPIPETFITKKGIVEHFLKIFQPGDHSIHVWDEETGVKASKELSLRPGKLEYGIEGYNGKYRVTFTVRDRNTGCPLPGAVIEICPEGEERKRERTSSDGTFTRDFSIGKRQFYRVRVPGAPPEEERKFWLYEDQTVRAQHREGE